MGTGNKLATKKGVDDFRDALFAVRACAKSVLCHPMKKSVGIVVCIALTQAFSTCKKEAPKNVMAYEAKLPPVGAKSDAPEFVRNLSLLYPDAEIYTVPEKNALQNTPARHILQKTNHPLDDVTRYYTQTLKKHGFAETTRLEETNGTLLQFERTKSANKSENELISIDITPLPYAKNFLIRIGLSNVDYSKQKPQ